jgi:hypothetical protein
MYGNNPSRQDRPAHRQTVQLGRPGRELQLLGLRERPLKRCDLPFCVPSERLAPCGPLPGTTGESAMTGRYSVHESLAA